MGNRIMLYSLVLALILPALSFNVCAHGAALYAPETTLANLLIIYNGDNNAQARYLAFAKKADEEGYGKVASLFRAAARAEQVHYESYAKVIKELGGVPKASVETPVVNSTRENLETALKGESYESKTICPQFLEQAKKEGVKSAIKPLGGAQAAEAVHVVLYEDAIKNLDAWKGANKTFYVCLVCGYIMEKLVGVACPVCATPTKLFEAIK